MSIINFILILLNTVILVSGQFLWKFGLQQNPGGFQSAAGALKLLLSPHVIGGLALYGAATVLWLYILSKVQLSLAYPVQSLAYIIAVFGAYIVFHEPLSAAKISGCLLILAGVTMIGWNG